MHVFGSHLIYTAFGVHPHKFTLVVNPNILMLVKIHTHTTTTTIICIEISNLLVYGQAEIFILYPWFSANIYNFVRLASNISNEHKKSVRRYKGNREIIITFVVKKKFIRNSNS